MHKLLENLEYLARMKKASSASMSLSHISGIGLTPTDAAIKSPKDRVIAKPKMRMIENQVRMISEPSTKSTISHSPGTSWRLSQTR